MRNGFLFRLSMANIRRSKEVYVPYFIATAILSSVYLLVTGLMSSEALANVPSGTTAQQVFSLGTILFTLFTFVFMMYINVLLIKRRNREFGLYGVLGLEKRHVTSVLVFENMIILGGGTICGIVAGTVLGRLLFYVLLKLMRAEITGSSFSLGSIGYMSTALLFFVIFAVTSLINATKVHLANPLALLNTEKSGEKAGRRRGIIPITVIGVITLATAYFAAVMLKNSIASALLFFPCVGLVIIGTYCLFVSGSIVVLRMLRANKKLYYKLNNFVAISSMFHRMRQNAVGLATICIISCMLVFTVATASALYLGQEDMLKNRYPLDFEVITSAGDVDADGDLTEIGDYIKSLAAEYNLTLERGDEDIRIRPKDHNNMLDEYIEYVADSYEEIEFHEGYLSVRSKMFFNVEGERADAESFAKVLQDKLSEKFHDYDKGTVVVWSNNIYNMRLEQYSIYGGLIFLAGFLTILFLCVAVLLIYFKQITEGYEDRDRFEIMRKVGMDDPQIQSTINKQVLWVFFLPLVTAAIHMAFSENLLVNMLRAFQITNTDITLWCMIGAIVIFSLIYVAVYALTSKVYYRIVTRQHAS